MGLLRLYNRGFTARSHMQILARSNYPKGSAKNIPEQLSLFPGTREAAEFHRPSHLGFFALNWRNSETKRESERVRHQLADLDDYQTGRFGTSQAVQAGAASVAERIEQITAEKRGKSPVAVRQQCYPVAMLPSVLGMLTSRPDFAETDWWISQNGFSRPNRRAPNVLHLNMLFVDLDIRSANHWLTRHTPEQAAGIVAAGCTDIGLPAPSFITWSGNGLHVKWLLAASAPRAAKPVWDALQEHLGQRLNMGGWPVDVGARDVSRVLRIPGSINQKGGELCRVVWVNGASLETCARYDFNALADGKTIMPWSRAEARAHKEVAKIWDANRGIARSIEQLTRPDAAMGRFIEAELWHERLSMIRRLVEMRHGTAGVPPGERNKVVWIAANALAWSAGGADAYFRDLVSVVRELVPSFTHAEVLSAASAVSKRVREEQSRDRGLYRMTNARLRELLAITDVEAEILFGSGRRRRPAPECQVGVMGFERMKNLPFAQYQAETKLRQAAAARRTTAIRKVVGKSSGRKSKRDQLMSQVLALLAEGRSHREIAKALSIAQSTISSWVAAHENETSQGDRK